MELSWDGRTPTTVGGITPMAGSSNGLEITLDKAVLCAAQTWKMQLHRQVKHQLQFLHHPLHQLHLLWEFGSEASRGKIVQPLVEAWTIAMNGTGLIRLKLSRKY
jgi:hypothetical protein